MPDDGTEVLNLGMPRRMTNADHGWDEARRLRPSVPFLDPPLPGDDIDDSPSACSPQWVISLAPARYLAD
jgi:hypothetical protein